jgi:uncharacterized protein (DUF1697 family)
MPAYVAFLRGIGPGNPNMRNDKLRGMFEQVGFQNVRTVISSGNVLFESRSTDIPKLEKTIELAFPKYLGYTTTAIIRSRDELQKLVNQKPFGEREHSPKTSLNITFLKNKATTTWQFPYDGKDNNYTVLDMHDRAVFSVIDITGAKTPELMARLEKEFGKQITTRTWNTVRRVLTKLGGSYDG